MMQYYENNTSYQTGTPQDSSLLMPATVAAVNSFCSGSVYFTNSRLYRPSNDSMAQQESADLKSGITISPNRTKGSFQLRLQAQSNILKAVQVIDISGKVRFTENPNTDLRTGFSKNINVHLSSGIYILRCITTRGTHSRKLVVVD